MKDAQNQDNMLTTLSRWHTIQIVLWTPLMVSICAYAVTRSITVRPASATMPATLPETPSPAPLGPNPLRPLPDARSAPPAEGTEQ